MLQTIKNRYTDLTIYETEAATLKEAVEKAVKEGADLRGADLRGADLGGADLGGAYLRGADLGGADLGGAYLRGADLGGADLGGAYLGGADGEKLTLIGDRPLLVIGPLGSRSDWLHAFITDHGLYIKTGCFFGPIEQFIESNAKNHANDKYGIEYAKAIEMICAWAAIWTPEKKEEVSA